MDSYKPYSITEKNKSSFYKGLAVGSIIVAGIGFVWSIETKNQGKWGVEKDALLIGAARYGVDPVTAKPVFEWNK
jgi:hypothetical protein